MKPGSTRKERVSWARVEEESLLQLYARARRDPTLRGENGLRMKGWRWLAGEMVARYGPEKNKPVIQSKFARLMREYKLYQWLLKQNALPARDDGEVDMDEAAWQRAYAVRRADVSVLRRFRQQRGFPLAGFCVLALADDGVLEPVPNASEHDHEDDEDESNAAYDEQSLDDEASRRAAVRTKPALAPAPTTMVNNSTTVPMSAPTVGTKRVRPPNSVVQGDAQRQRVAHRANVELAPLQAALQASNGRLFSPELEAKLSRCLDVVTAYFEASTAVLTRMGTVPNVTPNHHAHPTRDI